MKSDEDVRVSERGRQAGGRAGERGVSESVSPSVGALRGLGCAAQFKWRHVRNWAAPVALALLKILRPIRAAQQPQPRLYKADGAGSPREGPHR